MIPFTSAGPLNASSCGATQKPPEGATPGPAPQTNFHFHTGCSTGSSSGNPSIYIAPMCVWVQVPCQGLLGTEVPSSDFSLASFKEDLAYFLAFSWCDQAGTLPDRLKQLEHALVDFGRQRKLNGKPVCAFPSGMPWYGCILPKPVAAAHMAN